MAQHVAEPPAGLLTLLSQQASQIWHKYLNNHYQVLSRARSQQADLLGKRFLNDTGLGKWPVSEKGELWPFLPNTQALHVMWFHGAHRCLFCRWEKHGDTGLKVLVAVSGGTQALPLHRIISRQIRAGLEKMLVPT